MKRYHLAAAMRVGQRHYTPGQRGEGGAGGLHPRQRVSGVCVQAAGNDDQFRPESVDDRRDQRSKA